MSNIDLTSLDFAPGTKVRVTLAGKPKAWPPKVTQDHSVVGVVVSTSKGTLRLDHPRAPGARYGMSSFTWGRVFRHRDKIIMSVGDVPPYQADVISIEEDN